MELFFFSIPRCIYSELLDPVYEDESVLQPHKSSRGVGKVLGKIIVLSDFWSKQSRRISRFRAFEIGPELEVDLQRVFLESVESLLLISLKGALYSLKITSSVADCCAVHLDSNYVANLFISASSLLSR